MKYFAMIDGVRKGPFELEELPDAGVRPSTYIWCKGKTDWEKAEDDADVCRLFRNRLYDIMHPADNVVSDQFDEMPEMGQQPQEPIDSPTKFHRYIQDRPDAHIPTLDEIEEQENTERPPISMIPYAWLVTFLCCPPTGIAALVFAYKSRQAWRDGNNKLAHELNRSAKMWTGISLFLGFIVYAFIAAFF